MCINTKHSLMSIIEKVFKYEENEISVIKSKDEIWFRGMGIAKALGYKRPHKAVLDHVNSEDKSSLECLQRGSQIGTPFKDAKNESGLYSLILQSKLESALAFKR